ncbi:hypothetical protein GCM10010844_43760 [Deinococcus radiotolerans]|uniref:Tetratricopeptide repeat protein n=1 Tax=Deinococcus radiotolerans TaxID=1309407 RepID=A0ABQ2FRL3_9DEIO|nr:hypothetical protein GCM10010844_43760 [Deinococcus radiotolerans]
MPDLHARARHARQAAHPHAGPLTEAALQAARDTHQPALIAEHTQALLSRTDWTAGRDRPLRELLGLAQFHLGQPREAARTLRSIPAPSAEAADLLGRALLAAGDFEDGLKALDELPPPLPLTAQVTRARLQLHAGQADEALAALDELSECPGAPHAQIHLARANHAVLQHDAPRLRDAAQAALTHARGPHERADALNSVALAASWLGDFPAAQRAYEECLTLLRGAGREAAMQAVYGNLVNLHVYAADYHAAQQAAATALALARAAPAWSR